MSLFNYRTPKTSRLTFTRRLLQYFIMCMRVMFFVELSVVQPLLFLIIYYAWAPLSVSIMLTVFSQVRSISSNIAGGIQPIQVRFNCMITKLSYHVIILESKSAKVRWRWKEIWVGQALDHQRIWQWVQFSHFDCICVVIGVVVMIDWSLFLNHIHVQVWSWCFRRRLGSIVWGMRWVCLHYH